MATDLLHERLLAFVETLPDAHEDRPWGEVHCKVRGKIFVGWHRREDGAMSLGFKTDKDLQAMLVASDPRFAVAAYVGKHGWVSMKLDAEPSWPEIEHFIRDSYRMIAPKKLVKELDAGGGVAAPKAPTAEKRATPKRATAKPATPKPKARAARR